MISSTKQAAYMNKSSAGPFIEDSTPAARWWTIPAAGIVIILAGPAPYHNTALRAALGRQQ